MGGESHPSLSSTARRFIPMQSRASFPAAARHGKPMLASILLALALLAPSMAGAAPRSHGASTRLYWVTSPSITGTPMVGWALTAQAGSVNVPSATYSFQWQSCASPRPCTDIPGAGLAYFIPTSDFVGRSVRVVVTATWNGQSTSRASSRTGFIAPASI